MARPEFDQVAGVRDVCQLCHLHKVLLRRTAAWTDKKELYISMDYRDAPPPFFSFFFLQPALTLSTDPLSTWVEA